MCFYIRKTLNVGDDIDTNVAYNVHKECLKYFQHIFSNVRVVISLDYIVNKTGYIPYSD
jgi:hypothetical protein